MIILPEETSCFAAMRDKQQEFVELKRTHETATGLNEESTTANARGESGKKRRVSKALEKKYACPQDGCGKSYSRAEHLHRHQLNRKNVTGSGMKMPLTVFRHPEGDVLLRL